MKKQFIGERLPRGSIGLATVAYADPITTNPAGGTIVNGDKTFTFGTNACTITGRDRAVVLRDHGLGLHLHDPARWYRRASRDHLPSYVHLGKPG